ncbi:MAG: P-loop NTPase [Spirochaetes bacterium]|nr:P-loop NTPase [Spirochaetota bacterium]
MRIIPVASGKGGVGKSLVTANLGVAFAKAGKRVVLVDMDLGASNLHLVLGQHSPKVGVGTFLNNTKSNFADIISDTNIKGLRFIPGDNEIPGTANLKVYQLKALVKELFALKNDTDILLIDLGAGTHQSILDFFLVSGQGIIVAAPTVTSVLTAYGFLKNAVFRLMFNCCPKNSPANAHLEKLRKDRAAGHEKLYIPKVLPELKEIDPKSYEKFNTQLQKFSPRLIMNMVSEPKDAEVAMKIRRSCEEYLAIKIEHLGSIYRDALQDVALASRLPVTIYKPQAILSQGIFRIAGKIMQSPEEAYTLDEKQIEESFQEAGAEAEADFDSKIEYVEDLLHSGTLSHGDLLETVKVQQMEISKLKKENNFMKLKLAQALKEGFKVQ